MNQLDRGHQCSGTVAKQSPVHREMNVSLYASAVREDHFDAQRLIAPPEWPTTAEGIQTVIGNEW
jgi:hypothetical protein